MAVKLEKGGFINTDDLYALVVPFIEEIFDEGKVDSRLRENIAEKLGFIDFFPTTKKGLITTKLGTKGAPLVGETDNYTLDEDNYGTEIGYGVTRVFPGSVITSEAKKWLEKGGKSELTEAIKADLQKTFSDLEEKYRAIKIAENEYVLNTIVKGFEPVSAPFGPGSAVYDGQPLFSKNHKVIKTGETYSNIVSLDGTTHSELGFESLKKAIDMLRKMKDGQGVRVSRPASGIYDLYVSPELEEKALEVLSYENGYQVYNYSGEEAKNDNFLNIFVSKDGFKVRLNVLEGLNQPDSNGEGNIGSDKMWFVENKDLVRERGAFRKIILGDALVTISQNNNNNATVATVEKHFGAQILYPECIVGSKGDGSNI